MAEGRRMTPCCWRRFRTWAKRAMAAMAAAREAMDCSMRAWLALPIALPSAAAAALAACAMFCKRSGNCDICALTCRPAQAALRLPSFWR